MQNWASGRMNSLRRCLWLSHSLISDALQQSKAVLENAQHGPCLVQVDTMADALMPPGVRSLRQMLHATAVEVLPVPHAATLPRDAGLPSSIPQSAVPEIPASQPHLQGTPRCVILVTLTTDESSPCTSMAISCLHLSKICPIGG